MTGRPCYIARLPQANEHNPARTVVAAVTAAPEHAALTAGALAEWVRDGLLVESVPVEWARRFLFTQEEYRG